MKGAFTEWINSLGFCNELPQEGKASKGTLTINTELKEGSFTILNLFFFFWVFHFLFLVYSVYEQGQSIHVYAPGCRTEEQHWCSDPTLINGVCCLWLSCQQITPCAKINLISCVGLGGLASPTKAGAEAPTSWEGARAGAVGWQPAWLGSEGQEAEGNWGQEAAENVLSFLLSYKSPFLFLMAEDTSVPNR